MNNDYRESAAESPTARPGKGWVSRLFGSRDRPDQESDASCDETAASVLEPLADGSCLKERFEIRRLLRRDADVNRYLALDRLGQTEVLVLEAARPDGETAFLAEADADEPFPSDTQDLGEHAPCEEDALAEEEPVVLSEADKETIDDLFESAADASLAPPLLNEKQIIRSLVSPAVPRVLGSFVQGARSYVTLEWLTGRPIREAWSSPETTEADRVQWLIQLCRLLAELHRQEILHNDIHPDTVHVDDAGVVMLPDFRLARRLPLVGPLESTIYTAPEILLEPGRADLRADLCSIGAMWYALMLGRDLDESDFSSDFLPRPYSEHQPDANPMLVRLLLKTFARNPEQRFPSDERRRKGELGVTELEEYLKIYNKCLTRCAYTTGAQTSIGVYRTANEDNFFVEKTAVKIQDETLDAVLVVLADGMGGQEAGEIASEITVGSIRDELAAQLGGWPFMAEACERAVPEAIREAIINSHRAVHHYAEVYPERRGLGCTVDVVVCLGYQVFIGHVGDSRVGRASADGQFQWLTEDQTVVQRLVRFGVLAAEDAASHPDRSVLYQAIGGFQDVYPDSYAVTLKPGDQLICCSDGLNCHVEEERICRALQTATSPQSACDRLVNEANARGGTDNTTVVVVKCEKL